MNTYKNTSIETSKESEVKLDNNELFTSENLDISTIIHNILENKNK